MLAQRPQEKAKPAKAAATEPMRAARPSAVPDTRIIYCDDCLDQLAKLPDACVDRVNMWHRFPSGESDNNRNYEAFWGETKQTPPFGNRHASTQACIDYMRPRCGELARVLKKTGSFYYHCDWHHRHGNGRRTLGTD